MFKQVNKPPYVTDRQQACASTDVATDVKQQSEVTSVKRGFFEWYKGALHFTAGSPELYNLNTFEWFFGI